MANLQTWRGTKTQHEKCQIITEEIYKRINITYAMKKNKNYQSDNSLNPPINSDAASETDLFAYDSDLSSSCNENTYGSSLLLNNNEEKIKFKKHSIAQPLKIRKKYRKRAKKRNSNKKNDDGSSDDGLPLVKVVVKESETSSNHKECSNVATLTDEIEKLNPSGSELQTIEKFNNISRYGTNAPACFDVQDSRISKIENNSLSLLQKFVKSEWNCTSGLKPNQGQMPEKAPEKVPEKAPDKAPEKNYSCSRNIYPMMTAARKKHRVFETKGVPYAEKAFQSPRKMYQITMDQVSQNYRERAEFGARTPNPAYNQRFLDANANRKKSVMTLYPAYNHQQFLDANANREQSVIVSRKRQGTPIDHGFNVSGPQPKMMRDSSTEASRLCDGVTTRIA